MRVSAEGVRLFPRNTITTNGTVPLVDFGPAAHYVVSLDGPEDLNDELRGAGTFRRVLRNFSRYGKRATGAKYLINPNKGFAA